MTDMCMQQLCILYKYSLRLAHNVMHSSTLERLHCRFSRCRISR